MPDRSEPQPESEPEPENPEPVLEAKKETMDKLLQEHRIWFGSIFDDRGGGMAVDKILENLELQSKSFLSEEGAKEFKDSLKGCKNITDREEFLSRILDICLPLLKFQAINPKEYEEIQRDNMAERMDGRLSKVLYWKQEKGIEKTIFIHLGPAKMLGAKILIESVVEGLEKLADKLEEEFKEIETVQANSWIFVKHSELGRRMGFQDIHLLTPEEKDKRGIKWKIPLGGGSMSREEFLKRPWLKK